MSVTEKVSLPLLTQLLGCHSTPGDEDEVASFLLSSWSSCGLETGVLGRYAVWGRCREHSGRPVMLVCAHMDSPGYSVDRFGDGWIGAAPIGGARFEGDSVPVRLKQSDGEIHCTLWRVADGLGEGRDDFRLSDGVDAAHGDRICFDIEPVVESSVVNAPFMDNRVGCLVACEVASRIASWNSHYDLVVAATASEEMGGFGADVLAARIAADAVVVVDATYESAEQRVLLGNGPVLTLSDHSVLLGIRARDAWRECFRKGGVPLQTEVYNYSGTDARAFPRQGNAAMVAALLVPSTGNHSPHERIDLRDVAATVEGISLLAQNWPGEDIAFG